VLEVAREVDERHAAAADLAHEAIATGDDLREAGMTHSHSVSAGGRGVKAIVPAAPLFAGGVIGGVACASLIGPVARSRKWIRAERAGAASIGAALGFLAAALIATQTLSSPIGPALSTLLIGAGALIGAGRPSS
jgi:hypothetical protein